MFLSRFQMVFDKMAAIFPDFKCLDLHCIEKTSFANKIFKKSKIYRIDKTSSKLVVNCPSLAGVRWFRNNWQVKQSFAYFDMLLNSYPTFICWAQKRLCIKGGVNTVVSIDIIIHCTKKNKMGEKYSIGD